MVLTQCFGAYWYDRVFVLHRGDRLFPLRESETVRITDADPEDDHIELELQSARLGRGRVDVYGPAPSAQDFERWLDEVFEVTTAEADFQRYIGGRARRSTSAGLITTGDG